MEAGDKTHALNYVSGIKFTQREIDIISCVISGRNIKSISELFSISARTVESHIRSIRIKFKCNSKDTIARIAEKSSEYDILIKRYQYVCRRETINEATQRTATFNNNQEIPPAHNLAVTNVSKIEYFFVNNQMKHRSFYPRHAYFLFFMVMLSVVINIYFNSLSVNNSHYIFITTVSRTSLLQGTDGTVANNTKDIKIIVVTVSRAVDFSWKQIIK